MPLVAGIDSSTQACTIVLRDADDGRVVATAEAPHPPSSPPVSEQAPEAWWEALLVAAGQLDLRDVVAVSIDGQGHGLVVLDADGRVLRPAKLWNDLTATAEARQLVGLLGAEGWARRTGIVPTSAITIAKVLWLKQHEPWVLDKASMLLLPPSYLTYRLTGTYMTDRSEGAGTGYMGAATSAWDLDILALVDDRQDWASMLPLVGGPVDVAGTITSEAARASGFPEGIVVGPGANDQPVAALALGVVGDDVIISLGTSGTVSARSAVPLADPSGAVQSVADAAGAYRPLVCTQNATRVTDVFARLLGLDYARLAELALEAPGDENRPILLPYLEGERTPDRPDATGVLAGLGTGTTQGQIARAAFEGVLMGLLEGLERLRAVGTPADGQLILTGGGAHSPAYRQFLADLASAPVFVADLKETSATGAAVQAAAIHHRVPIEDVATAWAPRLHQVGEPRAGQEVQALRARYRDLVEIDRLDRLGDAAGGAN